MSEWNEFLVNAQRSLFSQSQTHRIFIERIMCEVPKSGHILEAGCGLAFLSKLLADAGYKVTAGDLDYDVMKSAREGLMSTKQSIDFIRLDLMNLRTQFQPSSFDAIVHSGVMEHFSDECIVHSFSEQKAVAKSVIFKVPNKNTKAGAGHFGDERFLKNKYWKNLITKGGFNDVRIYGGESCPYWMHLLPSGLHLYPKSSQSERKRNFFNAIAMWRRYLSKHTIFVCR